MNSHEQVPIARFQTASQASYSMLNPDLSMHQSDGQKWASTLTSMLFQHPWTCHAMDCRASTMDAILVRGQPYQTVLYRSLVPVVSTVHAILTVNGAAAVPGTAFTGARFVLGLNSGATWTVSPFPATPRPNCTSNAMV